MPTAIREVTFPRVNGTQVFTAPPPGYVCDFENPAQIYANAHLWCFGVGASIALIALGQRFYTKVYLSNGLRIDDSANPAKAASIVLQSLLAWQVKCKALGVHIWEMPLHVYDTYSQTIFASSPIFLFNTTYAKLALATFYLQLSPQKWFRVACWITIFIVAGTWSTLTSIMIFRCRPMVVGYDAIARATIEPHTCIDNGRLYLATAGLNIFTDVALFALSVPLVIPLRLSIIQKAGAILIFAIGSL
ncbi:hypothetical protein KEM52_000303 [Ascosphaera acerosa]|nr:hypothetical protein KEM52_000303 [Ascosphaera acerosa]